MLKTFSIGGVHPHENKLSAHQPIVQAEIPAKAVILLSQHIGAPAKPIVAKGDVVKVGTKIAEPGGFVSAAIHSSVSGKVAKIDTIVDASGYAKPAVFIDVEGDEWEETILAIKQTLYRVSGHSPIIAALAQAAENGKQVTVLVELKARFDEENNINWARKLEKAGCHVIYGLVGLKTHCKIALVVRREADGIRRYVHLGTGNYNDSTAKLYTDTGMFTCRNAVGEDATAVFNMLSGYSEPANWNQLIVAPIWMKKRFLEMIARETQNAKEGKPARIIAKCNSLCDRKIILALYEASCAGVQIDLIVRGICCLVAGKPGVSENIRVRSIVGTFLEHARIFYFYNDGNEEVYMGSADWMPRNLDRRVEIVFPVEAPDLKEKAKHILDVQLRDTLKAHCLLEDGTYRKVDRRGKEAVEAQKTFCEEAIAAANESKEKVRKKRTFDPLFSPQEAE